MIFQISCYLQVFFSLGISWGGIIMFGSYNKFDARVHVDAHIVSVVDFLTSLLASIVVFSTLGHSAHPSEDCG